MARRKKAEEEEVEDEDEEVYHVEVITKARVSDDGDWEYLVKWAGYGSDADSWEPAENVKQCDRLLRSFWKHVGTDDNDYPIGFEIPAREEWINKEKKYFADTFFVPSAKKVEKEVKKKPEQRRPRVAASKNDDGSHSESSGTIVLAKGVPKKRKVIHIRSDSGSESDRPAPKAASPAPRPPNPKALQSSSNPLKSLSFKKKKPSLPVIPAKDYTKLSDRSTAQPPPPPEASTRAAVVPLSTSNAEPADSADNLFSFTDDGPSYEPPAVEIPEKNPEEIMAEQFLKTVNIAALKTPIESENVPVIVDPPSIVPIKPTSARIPKKWKWTGDLFISNADKTELLCNVTIKNPAGLGDSSTINVLLSQMDSLRISKLYQFSELSPIFRACGKPQYFAQLESTEICDEVLIQGLRHHMITQQQIAMIPLSLDGVDVALLVIFPADFTGLTMFLCIPKDQVPSDSVLVALIPFSITALSSVKAGEKPVQAIQSLHPNLGKYHFLQKKPVIYQAIFSLGVPTPLLEFLDYPNRTYGIWFSSSDCGQSTSGVETSLLQLVLGSTKATLSHLKDEVRVIFIHVGSLPTIRSLPSLVAKLSDTPETQFFTYGTHPNVDSQRWGFHEIFPLGGIVTFTAGVLAEDPVGCCHVMSKLAEHPIWECFVTPNALAGGDLLAADSNPSSLSCMEPILGLIDSGQVALIRPSGLDRGNGHPWLSSFIRDCTLSNREILEACAANLKASGLSVAQLRSTINEELVKDMSKIQLQPVFMDQYRRFVIIKAASEASIPADKDGFEWCSLSSFSFKDDFFES